MLDSFYFFILGFNLAINGNQGWDSFDFPGALLFLTKVKLVLRINRRCEFEFQNAFFLILMSRLDFEKDGFSLLGFGNVVGGVSTSVGDGKGDSFVADEGEFSGEFSWR